MGINVTPSLYFSSNGLQNSFNLNKNSSMLAIVVSGIYYLRFPAQCNPDSATTMSIPHAHSLALYHIHKGAIAR